MIPSKKLALSIKEACFQTGLSRSTLYNLAKAGRLPIRKAGGRSLILTADIMALLMGSEACGSAE